MKHTSSSKPLNFFQEFFESEKTGGLLLILATALALFLSNYVDNSAFPAFWETDLGGHSLQHWVNDGLMAIFFLLVGLELEREIYIGELSNFRNALFPIIAAIGGILVPAGIHFFFNFGEATQAGAGIPTATDIAFSLGVLSLFGKRVPLSLKIFLTALAITDDLGAIFIIAIFYTKTIVWSQLMISIGIFLGLIVLNRLKVKLLLIYLLGGIAMWYFMLHSGVHATITGVLLAFAIPFTKENNISTKLQHFLHKPVAFILLPLFALANTCIVLGSDWVDQLFTSNSIGIFLGLVIGKPLGIILFCLIAVFTGVSALPTDVTWKHIIGASILAGIGFTMSIFVAGLAFDDLLLVKFSQIVVLLASVVAALIGVLWFRFVIRG